MICTLFLLGYRLTKSFFVDDNLPLVGFDVVFFFLNNVCNILSYLCVVYMLHFSCLYRIHLEISCMVAEIEYVFDFVFSIREVSLSSFSVCTNLYIAIFHLFYKNVFDCSITREGIAIFIAIEKRRDQFPSSWWFSIFVPQC